MAVRLLRRAQSGALHHCAGRRCLLRRCPVYGLYYNLFFDFEAAHHMVRGSNESLELAGIFSTYPNAHISVGRAFPVETVIAAILMCLIRR